VRRSYRAYGLGISSVTSIPGLEPDNADDSAPDVFFETGPEPEWAHHYRSLPGRILSKRLEELGSTDPSFVLTEHGNRAGFDLAYSDGTRFVVDAEATRVWGTFEPPQTLQDLATYFLGPVMGFLLRQRNITCLHASAVELAGCGVAFCGDAGFGKSTTAAALALRGVPVLSEDIVPLKETHERFEIVPGYPRICLWPDSVGKLMGTADALPLLTPVWEKRYLALDGVRARFCGENLPLRLIYLFGSRSEQASAPRIEKLPPREALLELVKNTYMNWLLDREQRAAEFDVLWRLVRNVTVRRVVAHTDARKIGALCELIEHDAASHGG
jgi:hypothetical protein